MNNKDTIKAFENLIGIDLDKFAELYKAGLIDININGKTISEYSETINDIGAQAFINVTRNWNTEKLNELRSINKDNMLVRGFKKIANIFHKIIFRP